MIRTYAALAEQNMSRRHGDWLVQDRYRILPTCSRPNPTIISYSNPSTLAFTNPRSVSCSITSMQDNSS